MTTRATSALALHGGAPVRAANKPWPAWPIVDDDDRHSVDDVLMSGKWWYGEHVAQFEEEFARFQGAAYCVSCTSGTAALEIALQAMGVGIGDAVIVPPYTFVATASAVLRAGAMPIFVDVTDTWCLDPEKIDAAVTGRTKAILPVHFGSCVADMDRINEVAKAHGLKVLEDACHSWGSRWSGKGTGTLGHGGVFSFQMSKNLTAGEGGAIVTDDEEFAEICRSISNCGRSKGSAWYHHARLGTNARLTELQAVLLRSQLRRLEGQTLVRERKAAYLNESLAPVEGVIPQPGDGRLTRRAYHLYALRLDSKAFGCSRERFVEACQAEGLPIATGYPLPLYKQPLFQAVSGDVDYSACACPVAEELCYESGCWLLQHILLGTREDMDDIVATIQKVRTHAAALK